MTKHTPGPWIFEDYGDGEFSLSSESAGTRNFDGDFKRHITGTCWSKQHGDLQLIAAAPDLLDALCVMTVMHRPCSKPVGAPGSIARKDWEDECYEYEKAMDAIRKATS